MKFCFMLQPIKVLKNVVNKRKEYAVWKAAAIAS